MAIKEYLEYRTLGLMALMMMVIVGPIIWAFVRDLRANRTEREAERQERADMRQEHNRVLFPAIEAVTRLTANIGSLDQRSSESHAATLAVLHGLKTAVDILCEKANGGK